MWPVVRAQHARLARLFLEFERAWRQDFPETYTSGREVAFRCGWDLTEGRPTARETEVSLAGRIDRIDRDDQGRLALIDYKGSDAELVNWAAWAGKTDVQMALYASLLEDGLVDHPAGEVVAANYYVIKKSERKKGFHRRDDSAALYDGTFKHKNFIEPEQKAELFDQMRRRITAAIHELRDGRFNPNPADRRQCPTCTWRTLCRAPAPELIDSITRAGAGRGQDHRPRQSGGRGVSRLPRPGRNPAHRFDHLHPQGHAGTQGAIDRARVPRPRRRIVAVRVRSLAAADRHHSRTAEYVFCGRSVHLAGLDAGFRIVSEVEGRHLSRLALREVILESGEGLRWLETYGFNRTLDMCRAYESAHREFGDLRPARLDEVEGRRRGRDHRLDRSIDRARPRHPERMPGPRLPEVRARFCSTSSVAGTGIAPPSKSPRRPSASKKKPELDDWHRRVDDEVGAFKTK